MTADQIAAAPTASKLRQEVRLILDQIKVTTDRKVKRQLAVRAFELVQQAEQLLRDEAWRRAAHSGQRHRTGPCRRP